MRSKLSLRCIVNKLNLTDKVHYRESPYKCSAFIKVETLDDIKVIYTLIADLLDTTVEDLNTPTPANPARDGDYLEISVVESNLPFGFRSSVNVRQTYSPLYEISRVAVVTVSEFINRHKTYILQHNDGLFSKIVFDGTMYRVPYDRVVWKYGINWGVAAMHMTTKPKHKNKWVVSHKKNVTVLRKAGMKGIATHDGVGRESRITGLLIASLKALGCKQKDIEAILKESSKQWKTRNAKV